MKGTMLLTAIFIFTMCLPLLAQEYDGYVLLGQSNAAGLGVSAELPFELQSAPPNVDYYVRATKPWPVVNFTQLPAFGPEVGFLHAMASRDPIQKILLVKFAVGSTSLYAWDPEWAIEKAALTDNDIHPFQFELYSKLMAAVANARRGKSVTWKGAIIIQGERDSYYEVAAQNYAANLSRLVSALRRDLNAPGLKLAIAVVDPPVDRWRYYYPVISHQVNVSAIIPNSYAVPTYGLSKGADGIHYDTSGQLELGDRVAEAF